MMNESISTFSRKNGKIVTKIKPRYKLTGKTPNYSSKLAKDAIQSEIQEMRSEISNSVAGQRTVIGYGSDMKVIGTKSTFPSYLRETGINTRKDFMKVLQSKKGKRYERVRQEAIKRLNEGYQNPQGRAMPDMEFKVKTGQVYDNKDIIFRRVRGRIIPIRVKKKDRYDLMEEAPF